MTELQSRLLGKLIRKAREKLGMTQQQLAEAARVDLRWLSRLESGEVNRPDPNKLSRISEALDLEPKTIDAMTDDLLTREMPSTRMHFRAKHGLVISPAQEKDVVSLVAQMHQQRRWDRERPTTD